MKGWCNPKAAAALFFLQEIVQNIFNILCGRKSTRAKDKYTIIFVANINRRLLCTGEEMIVSWVVEKERGAHLHQVP